jgi:hypothetical protein
VAWFIDFEIAFLARTTMMQNVSGIQIAVNWTDHEPVQFDSATARATVVLAFGQEQAEPKCAEMIITTDIYGFLAAACGSMSL